MLEKVSHTAETLQAEMERLLKQNGEQASELDEKDEVIVEMHESVLSKNVVPQNLFLVREPTRAHEATKRMLHITDTQHEPGSVDTLYQNQTHLKPVEQRELLTLLRKFPKLFNGQLGGMIGPPMSF